jgi:streptogramin lyase
MRASFFSIRWAAAIAVFALWSCAGASVGTLPGHVRDAVARSASPSFRTFTAGRTAGFLSTAIAWDIAPGPGGTMWFTDVQTPAIGRISSNGKIAEFTAGLRSKEEPYSIVAGPDGNMWFSDESGAIGRITPDGSITEFGARFGRYVPLGIAVRGDGTMWSMAVGPHASELVQVTVDGTIALTPIPAAYGPDGSLTAGDDGSLWFLAVDKQNDAMILRRTMGGKLDAYRTGLRGAGEPCCSNLAPKRLAIGPDGNLWFTTYYFELNRSPGQHIGTIAAGRAAFFAVDTASIGHPAYASAIASSGKYLLFAGSDPFALNGGLWRATSGTEQTAYSVPYEPAGLAAGSHGDVWFTSECACNPNQIVEAMFHRIASSSSVSQ